MHSPPEVFSPQSRLTRTASVQLLGSASFLAVVCLLSLTGTSVSGLQRGKKYFAPLGGQRRNCTPLLYFPNNIL